MRIKLKRRPNLIDPLFEDEGQGDAEGADQIDIGRREVARLALLVPAEPRETKFSPTMNAGFQSRARRRTSS